MKDTWSPISQKPNIFYVLHPGSAPISFTFLDPNEIFVCDLDANNYYDRVERVLMDTASTC